MRLFLALLAAASIGTGTIHSASAETLRAGGMGAGMAMFPALFSAFDHEKRTALDIIPNLGSNGGLRALSEGALDIVVSGRALKPDELSSGLTQAAMIRTPFVLVTSNPQPGSFQSSQVANVYKSPKSAWGDGSLIRIILRPKSDSDTAVLSGMFPDMESALEQARRRPEIPTAATDHDNADLAERLSGSLAGSTLTQILMEKRKLNFVALDGVVPSLDTFERGTYPFEKRIYFVLRAKKSDLAFRFIAFLHSSQGEAALRAAGNLPGTE